MELNFKECFQSKEYQAARKEFEETLKDETTFNGLPFYTDYNELQHILCTYYPEKVAISIMNSYTYDTYGITENYDIHSAGLIDETKPKIIPVIQKYNEYLYHELKYNSTKSIMPNLDLAYKCSKAAMERMQDRMLDWNMAFTDDHLGYYKNYNGKILNLEEIEIIGNRINDGVNELYMVIGNTLSRDEF